MHVFVYGTLVDRRVLEEVIGHPHTGEVLRARLSGFRRVVSDAFEYSFLIEDAGGSVDGLLIMDLSGADIDVLDRYEDVADGLYRRADVQVEAFGCGPRSCIMQAGTYMAGEALLRREGADAPGRSTRP
jgi:gamma-glutamylcyclotransferase (GGCT)/AIG2-like uncharacterized protein YtfP